MPLRDTIEKGCNGLYRNYLMTNLYIAEDTAPARQKIITANLKIDVIFHND